MLGGALIWPFLSLYVTQKFNVGMTQVGVIFGIAAIASIFGSILGGALSDMLGRKVMVITGLIFSATASIALALIEDFSLIYPLAAVIGVFAAMGGPAQQAMLADILPEEQRTEGFGMWRVIANLAVAIGPAIGGLLAGVSYLLLFAGDAITSLITATILFIFMPETRPVKLKAPSPEVVDGGEQQEPEEEERDGLGKTLRGYTSVLGDGIFLSFMLIVMLMELVYMQMNSTLAVYLRDVHGIPPQGFGIILSMNATMVVLFQFWISRKVKVYPPLLVLATGAVFYAVGFGMYGVVGSFLFFMLAMVVITIGEMFIAPVSQSIVAKLAPEDMRGRYMAAFSFAFISPSGVAVWLAGLIMDNFDPRWVWYLAFIIGGIVAFGYLTLHRVLAARDHDLAGIQAPNAPLPDEPAPVPVPVEAGD
jgi:MFS family permease